MRFDVPVLLGGCAVSGGLSVALATVLLAAARADEGPDVGPTAASLNEGFASLLGAAAGLFVGTALTAGLARRGPRSLTGITAGLLAYALVLVPILVATRPSDVGVGESLTIALAAGVPLGFVVLLGALVGSAPGVLGFLSRRFMSRPRHGR